MPDYYSSGSYLLNWQDWIELNWIQLNKMELLVWDLSLQHHQELGLSSTLDNSHLIFMQLFDKTVTFLKNECNIY